MFQVKIVVSSYIHDMENQINDFLKVHENVEIHDIKFQKVSDGTAELAPLYGAVIVYEE